MMKTIIFCLFAAVAAAGCGDDTTTTSSTFDMTAGCNQPITCGAGMTVVCMNGRNVCEGPGVDMAHRATSD